MKRLCYSFSILIVVAFLIAMGSCTKSGRTTNGIYKIKTEVDTLYYGASNINIDRHYYTYDAQGRLTADVDSYDHYDPMAAAMYQGVSTKSYSYHSGSVVVTSTDGGYASAVQTFYLNSDGLAYLKLYQYGSTLDSTFYQYDAQGVRTYERTGSYTEAYFGTSNGNIDNQRYSANGNVVFTYTYSSDLDLRDFGLDFLGKKNTNVLIGITYHCTSCGNTPSPVYHTFDNLGRMTYQSGDDVTIAKYTYF